jgi:hypothetical protein
LWLNAQSKVNEKGNIVEKKLKKNVKKKKKKKWQKQ